MNLYDRCTDTFYTVALLVKSGLPIFDINKNKKEVSKFYSAQNFPILLQVYLTLRKPDM